MRFFHSSNPSGSSDCAVPKSAFHIYLISPIMLKAKNAPADLIKIFSNILLNLSLLMSLFRTAPYSLKWLFGLRRYWLVKVCCLF